MKTAKRHNEDIITGLKDETVSHSISGYTPNQFIHNMIAANNSYYNCIKVTRPDIRQRYLELTLSDNIEHRL